MRMRNIANRAVGSRPVLARSEEVFHGLLAHAQAYSMDQPWHPFWAGFSTVLGRKGAAAVCSFFAFEWPAGHCAPGSTWLANPWPFRQTQKRILSLRTRGGGSLRKDNLPGNSDRFTFSFVARRCPKFRMRFLPAQCSHVGTSRSVHAPGRTCGLSQGPKSA